MNTISLIEDKVYQLIRENYVPYGENFICQLKQVIEANFKNRRGVDFYASRLSVSAKTLNKRLKSARSVTFSKLIQKRILIEGIKMIADGNKQLKEISYELGFRDASHFSRYFKRFTNLSPKEARILCKQLVDTIRL